MQISRKQIVWLILVLALTISLPFWVITEKKELRKRVLSWYPTFNEKHNNPYDSKALFTLLPDLFPKKSVYIRTDIFPNDSLFATKAEAQASKYNLFYAHLDANADREFANALSKFVYSGGEAFLAAENFSFFLEESFNINLRTETYNKPDGVQVRFLHPNLSKNIYNFPNLVDYKFFNLPNEYTQEEKFSILATDQNQNPIFIKIPFGKGNLYVCSLPLVFTNFGTLNDTQRDFIAKALSHLPIRNVLWEYEIRWYRESSPPPTIPRGIAEISFLRKNPPLWWAFWLAIAGMGLFIVFKIKREQRPIPIIEKNSNTSVEFAKTIGKLYLYYNDHKNIAEKKISYFLEFLRSNFQINISEKIDENNLPKLALKIGISQEQLKATFEIIQETKNKNYLSEKDLHHLARAIYQTKKSLQTNKHI